ncbi:MAG: DUF202 domain-containing protein [Nitrospiraceae bacterium]|nr:DUF202 domain-containing protein [Nitrospiraceae bacterium]
MVTSETAVRKFSLLADKGIISAADLAAAEESASARGLELEDVLLREYPVSRKDVLEALSGHYHCPSIEYDERLPVPPSLLEGLDPERLVTGLWFPVIIEAATVIIAANNPSAPGLLEEARRLIPGQRHEVWVALAEDIQWFIQDFLNARPGHIIGTERTGLAYWRNTMAHWRTRLACYRNDLGRVRTWLAFLRWGLGFIALADALLHRQPYGLSRYASFGMIGIGLPLAAAGLTRYLRIRRSRMSPPGHHTLVEVTAATVQFLEDYHFIEDGFRQETKKTMLGRLADLLYGHSTILCPVPASRERTQLARERNVLAAQRTVAACYRTIYSRARTGLAFIRTGVSFAGLGLGLMTFYGLGLITALDAVLAVAGLMMIADGLLWYLPVRKEQAEIPRSPVKF